MQVLLRLSQAGRGCNKLVGMPSGKFESATASFRREGGKLCPARGHIGLKHRFAKRQSAFALYRVIAESVSRGNH